jgi:hypothetical protein
MGLALTLDLVPSHQVQLSFPEVQDLPLVAPAPQSTCMELIVAPEVAADEGSTYA